MKNGEGIYRIVCDLWRLMQRHGFDKLTDEQWESFITAGNDLCNKYSVMGKAHELLFRDLFRAVQTYYEGR